MSQINGELYEQMKSYNNWNTTNLQNKYDHNELKNKMFMNHKIWVWMNKMIRLSLYF